MSQVSQLSEYRDKKPRGDWMAMPKGYCQVDNQVQQMLFRVDLNGTQHAIIQAVIQLTWRHQKTHAEISPNRLAGLMGRDVKVIQRNMKTLKTQRILVVVDGCVGVNTSVDDWQFGEKKAAASRRSKEVAAKRKTAIVVPNSPPDEPCTKGTEQSHGGVPNSPGVGDQTVPNRGTKQSPLNKKEYFDKELFEKEPPGCPVASDPTTIEKIPLLDRVRERHPEAVVATRTGKGVLFGGQADVDLATEIHRLVTDVTMDTTPMTNAQQARWANDIRIMVSKDGRTHAMIWTLFQWANDDSFWRTNVLCPDTLRKKWPRLAAKYNESRHKRGTHQPEVVDSHQAMIDRLNDTSW